MAEVILLRGAETDAFEIFSALFERNEARAEDFSRAVDRSLSDLGDFPRIGSPFAGSVRRKLVSGFYEYGVFYTQEGDRVIVHAILDLRQDPDEIRKRLDR